MSKMLRAFDVRFDDDDKPAAKSKQEGEQFTERIYRQNTANMYKYLLFVFMVKWQCSCHLHDHKTSIILTHYPLRTYIKRILSRLR